MQVVQLPVLMQHQQQLFDDSIQISVRENSDMNYKQYRIAKQTYLDDTPGAVDRDQHIALLIYRLNNHF